MRRWYPWAVLGTVVTVAAAAAIVGLDEGRTAAPPPALRSAHTAPFDAPDISPAQPTTTQAAAVPTTEPVPDLVGESASNALLGVKGWGYRSYEFQFTSSSNPQGTVIRQTPPAGKAAVPATTSFQLVVAFDGHTDSTLTTGTCSVTGPDAPGGKQVPTSLAGPVPVDMSGQSPTTFHAYIKPYLVAPKGWNCVGFFAEDGGTEIIVSPPGTTYPLVWDTPPTPNKPGIVLNNIPACQGCMYGTVCRFFTTGETTAYDQGSPCLRSTPPGEIDTRPRTFQVGFTDPPFVHGTGHPSGGDEQASGILEYFDRSMHEVTCALPPRQQAVCTAVLTAFGAYWSGLDTEVTSAKLQLTSLSGHSTRPAP